MNNKILTKKEAFELFVHGHKLEFFNYDAWWNLDLFTPVNVFKTCDKWRLKD